MKLSFEGSYWFVRVRWLACAAVFVVTWLTSTGLDIVSNPLPLYLIGGGMVIYNLLFQLNQRMAVVQFNAERSIFLQITCDLIALTLLLYFTDISRNPFLFFFVFHMIIASMYLHRATPYFFAAISALVVGGVLLLEYLGCIPIFPLHFPSDPQLASDRPLDGMYLLAVFAAFASTLLITVYFTTSIHRYVDRAYAELRQKEKMVGIGQLVAGIAHQIANPLDGLQNCLHRIGEEMKGNARLTEYVQMMTEALDRIGRTATRVQAFARPHGLELRSTDVNKAIESTLEVLGTSHGPDTLIRTEPGDVGPALGDPYTLQEVLFNLCTNALAAMPDGGTLTLRSYSLGRWDKEQIGSVAVDVSDTGEGIPPARMEKIFEPFYTTRADSGGTGLGLGLSRMLISEMEGRLTVQSTPGQGTTFTVVLRPADDTTSTQTP